MVWEVKVNNEPNQNMKTMTEIKPGSETPCLSEEAVQGMTSKDLSAILFLLTEEDGRVDDYRVSARNQVAGELVRRFPTGQWWVS